MPVTETYDQVYDRLIGEMLAVSSRAIGLARYYLRNDRAEDAQRVLDEAAAQKRDMGMELMMASRTLVVADLAGVDVETAQRLGF